MHPHLSAIGFVASELDDIQDLADLAANAATPIETRGGYCYLHWAGASGAEMWLQLSRDSKLIGLLPHFVGKARMRVALTERIEREDSTPLDQAYYAWNEPEPGEAHRTFALIFDCPNSLVHSDLPCPTVATVQVAAFPHALELFPSLAAFEAARGEGERQASSFSSVGLAASDGKSLRTAEAFAVLSGVIKETATRRNELTGEAFHWALLECMRGELDVVIDPRTVSAPPQVGGVASGLFWLSGRFVDYEKRGGFFDPARGVG